MEKVLTQVATHANTVADTFRAAFAKNKLGDYTVEMTAPEESTQGGKLALQHVRLKSEGGMAIVIGTVRLLEKSAELRDFPHVTTVHEQRFKRPPPFDHEAYASCLERAESILQALGFQVTITAEVPIAPSEILSVGAGGPGVELAEPRPSRVPLFGAIALAVATIGAIVYFVLS